MKRLKFSMAVCMICLLTMTSCSAAEVPANDKDVTAEPLAAGTTQTATFSAHSRLMRLPLPV